MSRAYRFDLEVEDANEDEVPKIAKAIEGIWTFDELYFFDGIISGGGEDTLYGGKSDDVAAREIADAIFAALGRRLPVRVSTTYLEDLPYTTYEFGEEEA